MDEGRVTYEPEKEVERLKHLIVWLYRKLPDRYCHGHGDYGPLLIYDDSKEHQEIQSILVEAKSKG